MLLGKRRVLRELLCLAAVLAGALPLRAQTLSWSTGTATPAVRLDPFVQSLSGQLYVAGGEDTVSETSTTWAYNLAGSSWTVLANMPGGRYQGSGLTVLSGKLYLVGGWTVSPGLPNTNLWVYDPSLNTWTAKASLPTRSGCGVSAAINGKLYVATPCDGNSGYRSFLHVYDPGADTWTALASSPHAHGNAAGGAINGKLYLAGGYDVNGATEAFLDVYDPGSNTWTTKTSMPTPRGDLRGAVLNGLLYAVGGHNMNGLLYDKVEVYDPSTDSWSTDAHLLTPTSNLGLAFNGTALYAVAGSTGAGPITSVEVSTSLVPTASSGFAGAAQNTASILWTWTDNGPASGYRVMQGASNLSGNLASGTSQWLQVGLSTNTQQASLFVQAFNSTGTANSSTASVYTTAAAPAAPTVTGVTINSAGVSWSTATNPANTQFQLEHSTDGATFVLVSSGVIASVTDSALNANTTYYYRVKAFNGDSIATAYSPAVSTRTVAGSAPDAPSGFAGLALSSSSIQWSWTNNASTATGVRVMQGATNLSGDLAANTTIWLQTGLNANTQEAALFVQAFNSTGTANSSTASRYSLALAPAAPTIAATTVSSVGVQWSTATNPANTIFQLEHSTDNSTFVLVSSGVIASWTDSGLNANTTYYYRVEAFNGDSIASTYSPSVSTRTVAGSAPSAPSGFAGLALSSSSIQWSWTNNASTATGVRVMQGATNLSGDLPATTTSWIQTGLTANTQESNLLVQAFNSTGTTVSSTASRYSLALAPPAPSVGAVTTNSASVSWSTTTNAANTQFRLEHSTDDVTFVLVSSGVIASATDAGLNANTTYYYRVEAFNGDSIATAYSPVVSTMTVAGTAPNAPSGFAGVAMSSSSIQWSWTNNASNQTGFRVMQGATNLSGDLAANTTAWTQSGLTANAQETSLFVQVFNATGTANSGTASRYSLALAPAAPSVTGVTTNSAGVSWSTTTNAANTQFRLEHSTDDVTFVLVSSGVIASYTDPGLNSNTTYYYRVEAFNGDSIASAYSPTTSTRTAAGSPPNTPSGFAGAAQTATSILWTWTDNGPAAGYRVMSGATNVSGDLPANATSWTQTGLSTNTAVGPLFARAFNGSGTADSSPATVYTLASAPIGTAVAQFSATAATITWSLNGSPAGTIDEVQRSTDGASFLAQFLAAGLSDDDTGLIGCTTYYYRVRQRNGAALNSAFDATISFETLNSTPAPAIGLTAQPIAGNQIFLSWTQSPTEGITGYRLFFDNGTGTINYAAPLAVLGSTITTYTTAVLISSPAYSFALRADHRCGVEETTGVFAASASTGALASVRAIIKAPDSGRRVNGNNVTVIADLVAGAPYQVEQISFQYRPSGTSNWLQIPASVAAHPNPATSYPYLVQWDVTGAAPGNYDLRAVAVNVAGSSDTAPSAVTIVVDPVAPTLIENIVAGQAQAQQTLNNAVSNTVATSGTGVSDPVATITLPAGALSVSTVVVTVQPNPTITTSPPAGFQTVGSAVQIDLGNGQHQLSGGLTANVTLTYPNSVTDPSTLEIMSLDPVTGNWTQDFASTVNVASRTISGNTPHFSIFVVVAGAAAQTSLDSVRIYPNPFKPNGPNADEGRNFSAGDPNSGIIFDNLTNDVSITIYTLSGRKVAELSTPSSQGKVRWDARNGDGRDAASGAYFAVFKSGGIKPTVKKFVIIR